MRGIDTPHSAGLRLSGSTRVVAAMALLILAGCGGEPPQEPASPTATAPTASAPAPPPAADVDPVERARAALRERRLVSPEGDNAVHWYLVALDQNPADSNARSALLELAPEAALVVESSIANGQIEEAGRELVLLERMGAGELRLAALRSRLAQARTEQARALEAAEEARQRAEAEARQAASRPPPAPVSPTPSTQANAATPTPAATVTEARPAAASPPTTASPPAVAAAAQPAAPTSPPASAPQVEEARQVVDVRPAYPAQARQRKVEGWVELEMAISTSGEVVDVEVVRSEPTRIFDREAIRAAQRWRFEPRKENGVPVATRVRKTVTFRLGG
jgi:periplasmic protein TonB